MLFNIVWGLTYQMKSNFKHLVHEYDHELVFEWFYNSEKSSEVWKLWDLSISHDIICGGYGKNLSGF